MRKINDMRKNRKMITALLVAAMLMATVAGMAGCGGSSGGNAKPVSNSGATVVNFWGWGGDEETAAFERIVEAFNKKYEGKIEVKYTQRPSSSYSTSLLQVLASAKGPDVFYVEDKYFKQYASMGYLMDITDFYNSSEIFDEDDMFPNTIGRYRYDTVSTTSDSDDPLYALPKDLAPTGIYYNATKLQAAGVTIISMTEEEALAAGYTVRGYDPVKKVFNNKIAMSWSDCVELSKLLMDTGVTEYGFFTEWWFNYGWSVGGDCIEYVTTDDPSYNGGRYLFTLDDSTKNYIVKDEFTGTITIGEKSYSAGEIISYTDKADLTEEQKANCNELPSQREAFTEFVRLSQPVTQVVDNVKGVYDSTSEFYGANADGNLYGYGITPSPSQVSSDGKNGYFSSGKVAMLVSTSSASIQFAENMKDEWDVAPMLVYKEYSDDGKAVLVHGVEAAHSGSVAMSVNAKTKVAKEAYLFAEFVASEEGQLIQAEEGIAIPMQISLATSDAYLTNELSYNKQVFIDACYVQTPGDWWYLRDKEWIDDWANVLNGDVRNGVLTLTQFYKHDRYKETQSLLDEYTKK